MWFFQDHGLHDDCVKVLMEGPKIQSTGYLARAVVNTVLKGGQLSDVELDSESCLVS